MDLNRFSKKKLKAYSFLEVIVSLAITAVSIFMMMNILILGFRINIESLAKSFVREEVSNISGLIVRDIRNADRVVDCGKQATRTSCEFVRDNRYRWERCSYDVSKICKVLIQGTTTTVVYESSPNLNLTIDFVLSSSDISFNQEAANIIVTITGNHVVQSASNVNVLQQTSVSTRNYFLVP